jgi:hypothetical protein
VWIYRLEGPNGTVIGLRTVSEERFEGDKMLETKETRRLKVRLLFGVFGMREIRLPGLVVIDKRCSWWGNVGFSGRPALKAGSQANRRRGICLMDAVLDTVIEARRQ